MATENTRGARKVRKGKVVSKMGIKSVVVEVTYREQHPIYGKVVVRSKKYHAHDEADTAKVGDVVTIMETRPLSATKRWRIVTPEKEASPTGSIRKGQVATAVIIRTGQPIVREDGQRVHFDQNACVLVDSKLNPIGSRVFGPVPRELREKNYMKILSMAPEVV